MFVSLHILSWLEKNNENIKVMKMKFVKEEEIYFNVQTLLKG